MTEVTEREGRGEEGCGITGYRFWDQKKVLSMYEKILGDGIRP